MKYTKNVKHNTMCYKNGGTCCRQNVKLSLLKTILDNLTRITKLANTCEISHSKSRSVLTFHWKIEESNFTLIQLNAFTYEFFQLSIEISAKKVEGNHGIFYGQFTFFSVLGKGFQKWRFYFINFYLDGKLRNLQKKV